MRFWLPGMRGLLLAILVATQVRLALADEGGVSLWLPGLYSSFAAVPAEPGWSFPVSYYHYGGSLGASHEFVVGGNVTAGIDANADLAYLFPNYTLAAPVWGGRSQFGLGWAFGQTSVSAGAKLSGPHGAVLQRDASDHVAGGSDLYPQWTQAWNKGTSNYMTYVMVGIPVGIYEPDRLANIGINHAGIDWGGGYTYLDPKAGSEVSAVLGFTYNFENPDTHYRNGFDSHLDWAASKFLSEKAHAGVTGYFYEQLGGDSGSGAVLGDFKSRVIGLGPELGRFVAVGGRTWYAQAKAYWEFAAKNRSEGWNLWLSLAIPLGSPPAKGK